MPRSYAAKNPWRKRSRQTEAEFDRIFFLMIRGASISGIASRMRKPELMIRDNYEYIVDNVIGHDITPFLYVFMLQFIPLEHSSSLRFMQEIAFWQRFPKHPDKALFECSFKCPLSPQLSDIKINSESDRASLVALYGKAKCASCPLNEESDFGGRAISLFDHLIFLSFMKRYREIRFNRKFISCVRLFRTIQMMHTYQHWLEYAATKTPIEFVSPSEYSRFVRYNLRALEIALKNLSLAAIAQRCGNHANLPSSYLSMNLDDRGGLEAAAEAIGESRFDVFHYKDLVNYGWANYAEQSELQTLDGIGHFNDMEMQRLVKFGLVPPDVSPIGTSPI